MNFPPRASPPDTSRLPSHPASQDVVPGVRFEVRAGVETLLLAVSLFIVLVGNRRFLAEALQGRAPGDPATWGFGLALVACLVALHFLLLAALAGRHTVKPLIALLLLVSAVSYHFIEQYGVYLDPAMLRNVLRSDYAEAGELLGWSLLRDLALGAIVPISLLSRVRVRSRPWRRAAMIRAAAMAAALATTGLATWSVFQPLSSLVRGRKELRYLITPANAIWSAASVLVTDARGAAAPRRPLGLDAVKGASWQDRTKPLLLVIVVGETARAANWGLNGYARQTTPELAHLPVINYPDARSCGTSTEVSVPCMFAPVGRRDYDEDRIRGSESLLHLLARAGFSVTWRDNQAGCKGVCDGLPLENVADLAPASMCEGVRCADEGLLAGLDDRLAKATGGQVLVLHQIGNHGPAYFRRYPREFERFTPACRHDDLRLCSVEEIVNAYDNALLYTDHLLAGLIGLLQARSAQLDSALLYVSDHGESLGESNLFLHGVPYPIAPDVQTRVPMTLWLSEGFTGSMGLDADCLRSGAARPVSHDNLFHTVLGLLDVRASEHRPALDLTSDCLQPGRAMREDRLRLVNAADRHPGHP